MSDASPLSLSRLQRYWPSHLVGEVLAKPWIDSVVPMTVMVIVLLIAQMLIPGYLGLGNLVSVSREFAEFGMVSLGMAIVVFCGGIDLSVGGVYALANLAALYLINVLGVPVVLAVPIVIVLGGLLGAINGFLIGILKIRAFLVTLATLVIFRAAVNLLLLNFASQITAAYTENATWDFLGIGKIAGVPTNVVVLAILAVVLHLLHTRSRLGWHIQAVGGARRAAHHAGIHVRWSIFSAYVACSALSALGGLFYGARQGSIGFDTGVGLEIAVLAAIVLGGVALGGGRGSVARAMAGAVITLVLTNVLVRLGVQGGATSTVLGIVLLIAIGFDVKWQKNRHKILQKAYVSPAFLKLHTPPDIKPGSGSPYELNDRLRGAEVLALGLVDGPEDVILDRQGRLYTGMRQGWIYRFSGENFATRELFANIGGRPLGLAFDRDDNLIVCVSGMGLYGVKPEGEVFKLTDQTNRSWFSIRDDSIIRLADDLDIAPDGKIYFSDASVRYDLHSWIFDGLEGRRNGRVLCYDPATATTRPFVSGLIFPNGICMEADGRSFLFAESYGCMVSRCWIEGPKRGRVERVIKDLPGIPDNINRASDGNYWLAMVGMRSPVWDLALTMPGFRVRMVKRVPRDEWLAPNLNLGCVIKFAADGRILDCLWDGARINNPAITSMREHQGWLYLGGLTSNRITRIKLDRADPAFVGPVAYWGAPRIAGSQAGQPA